MNHQFTKETFPYFEAASRNRKNRAWFEKNKETYEKNVRDPFGGIIELIESKFSHELIKMNLSPRRIISPLRQIAVDELGCVRSQSAAYLAESASSQYEYNPGIYISLGALDSENVLRIGLYRVSSRQMRRLRRKLVSDFAQIDSLLTNRRLKSRLGELAGEKFKRFPADFDAGSPAAKYLLQKNFYLERVFDRKEVLSPYFASGLMADIDAALPFLAWLKRVVGTYQRP